VNTQTINESDKPLRRWDIDWLRVIGILLVFVFHTSQPFNPFEEWHITNTERSLVFGSVVFVLNFWVMPLFMLLAGSSVWFSLHKRTNAQYARERVVRIFLPLLIGIFLFVSPQVYLERVFRGQFAGSFLQFFPHFFEGTYPEGNFSWHHLWFLMYLFSYALVALPLFRFLRGETGQRWVSRLAAWCERPGAIFLFAVPLMVGQATLGWRFPQTNAFIGDWAWHWHLFLVFVYGYILISDERFQQALERIWKVALILALAITVGFFVMFKVGPGLSLAGPWFWPLVIFFWTIHPLDTWSWLVVILALGRKYLSFRNKLLDYTSEAAYPFYILHQTVIVTVAFYVVQTNVSLWLKWPILALASNPLHLRLEADES
jgi:glucan biosynthesis protein C